MYDELVKKLRYLDEYSKQINPTPSGIFREAADAIKELSQIETDLRDCRNELCIKCGQYQTKHLGSCNGCRWEKS